MVGVLAEHIGGRFGVIATSSSAWTDCTTDTCSSVSPLRDAIEDLSPALGASTAHLLPQVPSGLFP